MGGCKIVGQEIQPYDIVEKGEYRDADDRKAYGVHCKVKAKSKEQCFFRGFFLPQNVVIKFIGNVGIYDIT